jgi:hypothetical protein
MSAGLIAQFSGNQGATASDIVQVDALEISKAEGQPSSEPAQYSRFDETPMGHRLAYTLDVEKVADFSVLAKRSPFRRVAMGKSLNSSTTPIDSLKNDLEVATATYRESGKPDSSCRRVSLSVEQQIKLNPANTLQVVELELQTNGGCTCEIVKSAIKASDAGLEMIVAIVETSIISAPETMNLASQCAIAASPESLAGIQALLAKYDPNAGKSGMELNGAKDSKSSKQSKYVIPDSVASMPSPLDFPGGKGGGPPPPGPGPIPVPPLPPPVITPPVTQPAL